LSEILKVGIQGRVGEPSAPVWDVFLPLNTQKMMLDGSNMDDGMEMRGVVRDVESGNSRRTGVREALTFP